MTFYLEENDIAPILQTDDLIICSIYSFFVSCASKNPFLSSGKFLEMSVVLDRYAHLTNMELPGCGHMQQKNIVIEMPGELNLCWVLLYNELWI